MGDMGITSQRRLHRPGLGRVKPPVLRLDPHPAWSRDGLKSCFNGAPEGRRQVYIADLSPLPD